MPSWNNNQFRAWIAIEGEEAEEYDVQTSEEDKTVTCWIASELGKRFSVHWENSSLVGNTAGHVYMDGIGCAGHMIRENAPLPAIRMTDSTTDGTVKKRFMFSTLELTDDDAVLETASNIDLGVISLQIYPIHIGPPIETQMSTLPETKLHERSKKAVTQQIKLGEAEILPTAIPVFRFTRAGPDIVIFKFKYRSADVLRANGIAPPLKRKAPESFRFSGTNSAVERR
ncbi:hypothetical protein C8F01DRAFT_1378202 [Mycena amicta]|nr:hypothetical protein C8F01DRAFT_1378202 [Mycena amicta]